MVQVEAPVVAHRPVARDHYWMRLEAPIIARRARPGQFVHVGCWTSPYFPLLRRPLSLLDTNPRFGTIDFIYKVVGLGTRALAEIPAGAQLDTLGPLGNDFKIPTDLKTAILVGGGVGIPPLVLLAKWLKKNCPRARVLAFLGARTKEWVLCADAFRRFGAELHVATDDGTLGHKGSVVDLLQGYFLKAHPSGLTTVLYICGPTPMMKAATWAARRHRLPAQVSLEERMGCAMGCCWGCVVEMANEPLTSHARFKRICTEGPVFPAEAIAWG